MEENQHLFLTKKQNPLYKKWTESIRSRPTIGLTIFGLDNSINNSLWRGVIDTAKAYDVNVISFMARDLDSPLGFQYQSNVLFDLISPNRLDGLLIWTVPIINIAGPAGIKRIFEQYRSLPIVAIEEGAPEYIPRVVVDSYQPVHDIVTHIIEKHGRSRIAFVRGPDETHIGARRRYQGYLNALAEHNLPADLNLVSPSTGGLWIPEAGEAAISLFLDERNVEFDAVIGVNDAIAIEAMRTLKARGIHVPNDVSVAGFDDLDAGTCVIPPLTTVSLQSYEQGRQAVEMMIALLVGNEVPNQVNVPLPLIVRQSCGCISPVVAQVPVGLVAVPGELFETFTQVQQDHILSEMLLAAPINVEPQPGWGNELLASFFLELTTKTAGIFLRTLDVILRQVMAINGPVAAWQNVISAFRRNTLPYLTNPENLHRAEDLWLQAQVMIGETALLMRQFQSLLDEKQSQVLNEINSALITTFDVDKLMDVVAREFPRLGISGCYVSLYENPQQPVGWVKLILAYDERGRLESQISDRRFAAPLLIPSDILPQDRRYSYVVEALYFREEQLGFVLFEEGSQQGRIYYMLREQLSSALKGALLVHQLEEQKMQAEKARETAEKASQDLEAFAYSVSHDLRAPLRHIDSFIQLLYSRTKTMLDDKSQHYMRMIEDASHKMGMLIDDLLSFSRMSHIGMFKTRIDLNGLIQNVIEELAPEAETRNVQWHIASLPTVVADRAMLRIVLVNLIANALKFTLPRETAEIEIGFIQEQATEATFFVRDNGVGFDMTYVDKLFGVFQRLHRQEDFEGTGIGLANVRRIISRHNGRTWAEGEIDHGATFYFSLPILKSEDS